MRKTKSAVRQPHLDKEIARLEAKIPKGDLKQLQKEADLREYSDGEYLDLLEGYIDNPDKSKPEYKNFHFISDNAVVILTEADEKVAWETLSTIVRFPNDFHLEETP
jgi:hypothetical protein